MDRKKIISLVNSAVAVAEKEFNIKLDLPKVDFYQKGRAAGKAMIRANKVIFNEVLAVENSSSFKSVVDHEVAHLVANKLFPKMKQQHGPEFKMVATAIGGSVAAKTYHNFDVASVSKTRRVMRYEVKCSCKTHLVTKAKSEKIRATPHVCAKCNTRAVLTGVVFQTQRG